MLFPCHSSLDYVDWSSPVNRSSALNVGLVSWLLAVPGTMGFGSSTWRNLVHVHNGTLNNFANPATSTSGWSTPFGRRGGAGAVKCDSSNDYVSFSNGGISGFPFTLAAWSRIQSTNASYAKIISIGSDTANRGYFEITTRPFSSTVHRFGIIAASTATVDTLNDTTAFSFDWHHVCLVVESATSRLLYVDGRLAMSQTASVAFEADIATGSTFLGAQNLRGTATATLWHNGLIDDAREWNVALSPAVVLGVYRDSAAGYPETLRRVDLDQWFADTVAGAGGAFKGYWAWRSAQVIGGGAI